MASDPSSSRPVEILLVEDDPADVALAREAVNEGAVPVNLNVVGDGVEALAFLRREGEYADAAFPDIVLLDLKLPRKNGFEVLAEMKDDAELRQIPVVVLSTSSDPADLLKSYDLQASFYITKSDDLATFVNTMRSVHGLSVTIAKLPFGS